MEQNFWTILLTYSFIQGYVIGIYSMMEFKRSFLGLLLICVSTLIWVHLYYRFEWFDSNPNFIFLDAPIWYLIGPLFLFYVRRLFDRGPSIGEMLLHLLPALGFIVYLWPFLFLEGPQKVAVFKRIFSVETFSGDLNHYLFSAHILVYLLYAYYVFQKQSLLQRQQSAQSTLVFDFLAARMLRYYLGFFFLAFSFYAFTDLYYQWAIDFYEPFYLALSALIHMTFYYAILRQIIPDQADQIRSVASDKYQTSNLTEDDLQAIADKVQGHVAAFEVYRNPELRLRHVSDELGIPSHHISQALNVKLRKTFFDLVNDQRVRGVKTHLPSPRYANYTLAAVAAEHGFKSSSSFYRIFRKHTGKTPKEYLQGLFVAEGGHDPEELI